MRATLTFIAEMNGKTDSDDDQEQFSFGWTYKFEDDLLKELLVNLLDASFML